MGQRFRLAADTEKSSTLAIQQTSCQAASVPAQANSQVVALPNPRARQFAQRPQRERCDPRDPCRGLARTKTKLQNTVFAQQPHRSGAEGCAAIASVGPFRRSKREKNCDSSRAGGKEQVSLCFFGCDAMPRCLAFSFVHLGN